MRKITTVVLAAMMLSGVIVAMTGFPGPAEAVDLTPVPVLVGTNSNVKDSISMSASDDGRIYVVWSERIADNPDIIMSYSSNNGTSFSPGTRVNANSAGSQRASQVATSGSMLYVVWQDGSADGGDIILARSGDGGLTFEEMPVSDMEEGTQANPAIAAAGQRVAVAWEEYRSDNTIRLWQGGSGNLLRSMTGHTGAVMDAAFSPNGTFIASGSEDSTVKIWNAATGSLFGNLTSHTDKVLAVDWSKDGNMLATGSFDHDVIIFDTIDFSETARLNSLNGLPTKNYPNAVSFSPGSDRIAVSYNGGYGTATPTGLPTQDFNLTVWNLADHSNWTRNEITPDPDRGHTNSVMDVAFSHNGTFIATGSKDSTIKIWNSVNGQRFRNINMGRHVLSVSWSPDDRFVAAGLGNGSVAVVNISNTADVSWMGGTHTGGVNSLDWNAAVNEIVTGASDPLARVWHNVLRTERLYLPGHMNSVYSAAWSPGGEFIVTAGGMSDQYDRGENQIFCAVSDDGGLTFDPPVMVGDSCARNRLRPKASIGPAGTISIAWYDSRAGNSKIYLANSTDGGQTFGGNVLIGHPGDTGDDAEQSIFTDGAGTVHAVWQYGTGTGVRYANSSDGFAQSRIMAPGAQVPCVSASPDGGTVWVSWRQRNLTTQTNQTWAAISNDGGNAFNNTFLLNQSRFFVGKHALHVDRYNQTNVVWEVYNIPNRSIYHRSAVLSDEWAPQIVSTSPEDGDTGVSIFTNFTIRFSEPMDRDSAEAAFSWTDGTDTWDVGDCVGNRGAWNGYGDTVTFSPRTPLQYQKNDYSFSVDHTARDLAGNLLGVNMTFRFTTRADTDPPMIVHYPSQGTVSYDEEYTAMAVITDQWGNVAEATLHYQGVGDTTPMRSVTMDLSGTDTYLAGIPAQLSLGTVYYYIRAADDFGNVATSPADITNQSMLYNVSVVDGVRPEIRHLPLAEADVFRPVEISAVVIDGIQLSNVSLNYRPLGSLIYMNAPMQAVNGTPDLFSYQIPAQASIGMIHYNITALDASGNFNATPYIAVQILDRTVPLINYVTPLHLDNQTKVLITANVTDDVGVGSVTLYFKSVGGDQWVSRQMTHVSGDIYEFTIPAQRNSGTIYYYVNATDTSGNAASTLAEQDQFQIEVVGVDPDNTIYYLLGVILAILIMVLGFLLVRKYMVPASNARNVPRDPMPDEAPEPGREEVEGSP